jgi:hypothetical protein
MAVAIGSRYQRKMMMRNYEFKAHNIVFDKLKDSNMKYS